jgi:hypothetical protein
MKEKDDGVFFFLKKKKKTQRNKNAKKGGSLEEAYCIEENIVFQKSSYKDRPIT